MRRRRSRHIAAAGARTLVACSLAIVTAFAATTEPARGDDAPGQGVSAPLHVSIGYLGKNYVEPEPLSLVDKIYTDKGVQGARIALSENNITGRLLSHDYRLAEAIVPENDNVVARAKDLIASGTTLIVTDLEPTDLISAADLPEAANAIFFNIRASDIALRHHDCRKNVFHIPPDFAMRADALAQYLVWKKWRRWAMIAGERPRDQEFAQALRRAAKRFGAKIVAEKSYAYDPGSRRTDTGHQQIQTQMPLLTQGLGEHDVIVVADIEESFGDYLMFRTFEPRPIAGTHGLIATSWHRSYEESAATQMQNRFEKRTNRIMTERDYSAWLAVRTLGEAVTRTSSTDAAVIRKFLLSPGFEVAGFKSQGLNFRSWDRQMRQPILLAGPRALVSISPQEGFLHPHYLTDTLGYDEPETKCSQRN